MAQGLDLKNWDEQKSPPTEGKPSETVKRTRSMGSRRIFPPQFKLQVLDSYRNDLDCRGNQRATARKYNIHRRQIQKWLQCEQNLRSSVEESGARKEESKAAEAALGKSSKKSEIVKSGDDATLNRSAMIYARLSDAERSRDENAVVRPTLNSETKVYDPSAVKLDAWNLKRVAQKLYPSSHEREAGFVRWSPRAADASPRTGDARDDNFNRVSPDCLRPASDEFPPGGKCRDRSNPTEILPGECCKTNDEPLEMFAPRAEGAARDSSRDRRSRRLSMGARPRSNSASLNENVAGQKLCDGNAAHKCLVQKYTDCVEGQKFCAEKNELLLRSGDAVAEPNCLPDVEVAARSATAFSDDKSSTLDDRFSASDEGADDGEPGLPSKTSDCNSKRRNLNEGKSYSPKRRWMKESMLEQTEGGVKSAQGNFHYAALPIKQRVKMNLKSAAAAATPSVEEAAIPKGVSPNFSIEKLCSSDIKTENVTPPSFHSFSEPECYGWRPDTCVYPSYPLVNHSPLTHAPLPFPPPLLFTHRVIPDLVSLHFKPESPDDKGTQQGIGTCSPEPFDVPLKEEKVSDGEENMDIDVLSTTPVEKKSFDFAGYNLGKRRSFSVQFKLTVLDAFYNDKDCNKNQRATARKFNINRRQVQKWLSQESDLRSEGSIKNGKYLQRQRLGNERELDGEETCKQCPQHCSRKKKETEEMEKTIEVNVKHCTDRECLSREKSSPDSSSAPFSEGFEFYNKGYYQSDLKSANILENYLIPDSTGMMCHDSFLGWPNLNSSALQVPSFRYMSSWYHNFDYCQEKSKIY